MHPLREMNEALTASVTPSKQGDKIYKRGVRRKYRKEAILNLSKKSEYW